MKKTFACSIICHGGIIGGGIHIEDHAITYKTNKLTVDRKYKNLELPLSEVCELSWAWIVFPIATLRMKNGEQFKFMIFNKKRFTKYYNEVKQL